MECQNFGPFHHLCACEGADIGVRCGQPPECQEGSLRLEGGVTQELGRLEICVNGVWGVVCNKDWDDCDSAVACKELGFNTQGKTISIIVDNELITFLFYHACILNEVMLFKCPTDAIALRIADYSNENYTIFGRTVRPFVLGNVQCSGGEPGILNCNYNTLEGVGCTRGMEVALSCIQHGILV